MQQKPDPTNATCYLGQWVNIIIDRPLGGKHPKHEVTYLINYGYVPNTLAGDDKEQDVYVLGVHEPLDKYFGFCAAVIERLDDVEDKLVLVPDVAFTKTLLDKTIVEATDFIEQYFDIRVHRFEDC